MLAALIATRSQFSILTQFLPNGTVGIPYSTLLLASGGVMPYTWAMIAGSLPAGLVLNSTTGEISGTPTTAGISTFTVQVTDAHSVTATKVFTLTIIPANYGNQFVAATTTFTCITLTKLAASLSTNPVYSYQLLFSTPGQESILSKLNRFYYNLVSASASNDPAYLSNQIVQVIEVAFTLNGIIQALPVAAVNTVRLSAMQREMGIALRLLLSLAIPITLNYT